MPFWYEIAEDGLGHAYLRQPDRVWPSALPAAANARSQDRLPRDVGVRNLSSFGLWRTPAVEYGELTVIQIRKAQF